MLSLFIYTFMAFGIAWGLGHSKLSLWLYRQKFDDLIEEESYLRRTWRRALSRFMLDLVECPGCLGWWTGLCVGLIGGLWAEKWGVAAPFILAFYTCATNLILGRVVGIVEGGEEDE